MWRATALRQRETLSMTTTVHTIQVAPSSQPASTSLG